MNPIPAHTVHGESDQVEFGVGTPGQVILGGGGDHDPRPAATAAAGGGGEVVWVPLDAAVVSEVAREGGVDELVVLRVDDVAVDVVVLEPRLHRHEPPVALPPQPRGLRQAAPEC